MNQRVQPFLLKMLVALVCMLLWGPAAAAQTTPTPGQNINIASGPVQLKDPSTGYVTILGDPFLQRQNEPSVAVSTVNPLHLLAGGNDYRAVDIPFPDVLTNKLVGDAWCGWYSSTDGGLRWQSTLLPGYPQDNKPLGLQSPLRGYKACSDATVRPGPGGMFYFSGIAFNRDTNQSVVFVARFLDRNYAEKGNVALNTAAIQYVDTVVVDTGTSGQFIDKTWNAVLLQSSSAQPCSIQVPKFLDASRGATDPTQTETVQVPAMSVYVVWSRFTGSTSSKIMVTKSDSCGNPGSYGALFKVSESNSINQGTVVAVNQPTSQTTGDVFLAWRRFGISKTQPDAIMAVKCGVSLKTCSKTIEVTANVPAAFSPFKPFDQQSTQTTFRTNSMPAMAVSVDKNNFSRVHIAFAARDGFGDAKILLATSSDGVTWPQSQIYPVEPGPIVDDKGNPWGRDSLGNAGRGDQLMPAMTFTEGKLVIAYYFSHFDHTVGQFEPNASFTPDPTTGKFFKESRDRRGELLTDPDSVYSNAVVNGVSKSLNDTFMVSRRHTLDVRMAQADVNDLNFPNPSTYAMISRYVFGLTSSLVTFEDYQANPPDLALFANGNNAFVGDYIDVAGSMFVQGSSWKANNAPSKASVHYVVWTDNRDVQPPADGNYANFTPAGFPVSLYGSAGGASFFDPNQPRPACTVGGQAGMKDQNIYISPVTQGFAFSVPQNMKPLGYVPNTTPPNTTLLDRAFTALLNNSTKDALNVRLTITNQPPDDPAHGGNGRASFIQNGAVGSCTPLVCDVFVPAHSGISRSIFVRSSTVNASIGVTAAEITQIPGGTPVQNGFSASVVLNAQGTVTTLLQPEGVPPNLDISTLEAYNGSLKSGSLKSGSLKSGSLKSGSLKSGSLKSGSLKSGSLKSGSLKSGSLKSTSIADLDPASASSVTLNGNEVDPSISNTCTATSSPDDPITDAIYVLSNEGNTIATYTIRLLGTPPAGSCPVQLIIAQPGLAVTSQGCELAQQDDTIVLANITDLANLGDLAVSVPPGESLLVTIRGASIDIVENATENAVPQAAPPANSDGTQTTATPLFITTTSLPSAVVGVSYPPSNPLATLAATGGTPAYSWQVLPGFGSLPSGLTLDPSTGQLTGTPSAAGTFTFKVQVCDSNLPQGAPCDSTAPFDSSARRILTLTVSKNDQTITVTTPAPASAVYNTSFSVAATASSGLPVAITTTGVCSGSGSGSATILMTSGTGICTVHYNQAGDANYNPAPEVTSDTIAVKANQSIAVTTPAPASAVYSTSFLVAAAASSGLPVAITTTGVCSGSGIGSASITMTSGTGICTVHYNQAGDANYNPAPEVTSNTAAVKADSTATITSDAPDPSIVGQSVLVSFTVAAKSPATGTPSGNVTVSDGTNSCGPSASSCTLTFTTVGTKTLTATYAGDNNFNGSVGTASHQVNYNFNGFLSPLNTAAGTLSNPTMVPGTTNRGSVVPLKWILTDYSGNVFSNLSSLILLQAVPNSACAGPPSGTPVVLFAPTSGAAGGSTFRFSSPQFIFNWDTSTTINSAAGCFTVVMQLNDGGAPKAMTIKFQ